ncbi:hypothetical protein [Flavobacterium channae]|uniref:hypothetical protein n=1 Tax=Flavobacterium channae TaxID=2897181 RepID=UPI001E30FCA4|nr:hypothetical protein [Flavobacterium channae]UGS24106.1 hypothetical protein LOS89_02270 [Flavobacterium channae]
MKKLVLLFVLFVSIFSFGQESYKYVIVPKKFNFFKEENKYNLNSITKSFFEKEGFQVVYDTDPFPADLAANRCSALYVNVLEKSNMLKTKITFEIKDCQNRLVLTSKQGESRDKEYEKAYNESFRTALVSMRGLLKIKPTEIEVVKSEEVPAVVVVNENKQKPTPNATVIVNENQLFAIPTSNGFKLVDAEPKTIMILKSSSVENVFIAQKGALSGVLLKNNNSWFFEYYNAEKLVSEKLEIKF